MTLAGGEVIKLPRHKEAPAVPAQIDSVVVSGTAAVFYGHVAVEAGDQPFTKVSLYYSNEVPFNVFAANSLSATAFGEEGSFKFEASNLKAGEKYSYCLAVQVKSKVVYSSVAELVIPHSYSVVQSYDMGAAHDLSSAGTANCYIVSQGGLYKFKAVKGNSNAQFGSAASAQILWESFGSNVAPECLQLVEGVCYKEGYVAVKIPEEFKEGNAVVALKDATGNILWSWHIWMTDAPVGQVYYNNAGTMMDRNIGAISTVPGDVGTYGLLYQWGRKDPFLGSSTLTSTTAAKSTITWPSYVESDPVTGTMEYAVANPTTYIAFNKMNYDWFYTDGAAADTTRWAVATAPKTVYDPCPYGWRVPEGGAEGVWGKALGIKSSAVYTFDSDLKGSQMGGVFGDDENIWYPASGCREYANGGLIKIGSAGVCQSVTVYKANSPYTTVLYWTSAARFYVYDYGIRARAYSVRCIKE